MQIVPQGFGQPFIKRFALSYQTVVLSVLSVTLVHCGQTVGWIKMKLGTQVGPVEICWGAPNSPTGLSR